MTADEEPAAVPTDTLYDRRKPSDANYFIVQFRDDHSFDGARFASIGLTAEQLAFGVFHMSRMANRLEDSREFEAAREAMQAQQIAADLRSGSKGAIAAIQGHKKGRN